MLLRWFLFPRLHERIWIGITLGAFLLVAPPGPARADALPSRDAARADELFQRGKERLSQLDYAGACPLLAQSVELDPASGSLLALAMCHEREGKLASALREYKSVIERSQRENRPDRERAAQKRVDDLQSKVSTLAITPPKDVQGLTLRVNGAPVEPGIIGTKVVTDGGSYTIEASAPGKKTWTDTVVVAEARDDKTVTIPALASEAAAAPLAAADADEAPAPARETKPAKRRRPPPDDSLTTTQWAGLATMGAGLIVAGVGGAFVLHAVGKDKDSEDGCVENLCTADSRRDRLYARDAGNAATIALITSGGLLASGLVLYLVGGRSSAESQVQARVSAGAWALPGGGGAQLHGTF
jgi:hypothetical protein